jgi:hypothetical protein
MQRRQPCRSSSARRERTSNSPRVFSCTGGISNGQRGPPFLSNGPPARAAVAFAFADAVAVAVAVAVAGWVVRRRSSCHGLHMESYPLRTLSTASGAPTCVVLLGLVGWYEQGQVSFDWWGWYQCFQGYGSRSMTTLHYTALHWDHTHHTLTIHSPSTHHTWGHPPWWGL